MLVLGGKRNTMERLTRQGMLIQTNSHQVMVVLVVVVV